MRRLILFRILALLFFASFCFWLGTKQRCNTVDLLTREKATSRQDEGGAELLRAQTAKFNRNARKYALERKCCGKDRVSLSSLSSHKASNLFRHVIVDKKNNFLYCFIPKVASSNMKRLILTLQGKSDNADAIKHFDQRGFQFLDDFNAPERARLVKTLFKFLFVRDPLSRLVSAYRNKFQSVNHQFHRTYGRKIVVRYRENISSLPLNGNDVTFQEFARYLIDKPAQEMNEHWMPMYDICQPCAIAYDFVGSFEQLDLDTRALLVELNASSRISFPKKQAFYQKQLYNERIQPFYGNITVDEFKFLHRKYMKDFKCFSYPFPNKLRMAGPANSRGSF